MRILARKLLRDLRRQAGQMLAVAAVVACGVSAMVAMRSNHDSLLRSRDAYYAERRFADAFAHLRRAPDAVASMLRQLPGVTAVEPRVVAFVTLDVPGLAEPATGELVSLPADATTGLNGVHLRAGRLPLAGHPGEAVVSEIFAEKNGMALGDSLAAVMNGRWRRLVVVGVGLSPEFVYEAGPGQLFPDNRRFGVLWLRREELAPTFDLDGAFNDVSLALAPGADAGATLDAVDRALAPYGGLGAIPRAEQASHRFLTDELTQHKVTGVVIGYLFLVVAAFLLHLVLSRLIAAQREQVGVLKAFGYRDGPLAWHYFLLGLAPMVLGFLVGAGAGEWLGRLFTELFGRYYRFPALVHVVAPGTLLLAAAVTLLAGGLGTVRALRAVTQLPPAEAMRAAAPASYRGGHLPPAIMRRLGAAGRMAWRQVARRPLKAALTVAGIALATALLVVGRFFVDAIRRMTDLEFQRSQRQDAVVIFSDVTPGRVRHDLARLPGVRAAETFRTVAVRLRAGPAQYRTALMALDPDGRLRRLVALDGAEVSLPRDGIVLNDRIADRLDVVAGDRVTVEVLEGRRPVADVVVARVFREALGATAYTTAPVLSRLLQEAPAASGAFLASEPASELRLASRLKALPRVSGSTFRRTMIANFEATLAESMGISTLFLTAFAVVIAVAIVYNGLRIALSERARELASLRVLGFGGGQVALMLVLEHAALTLIGVPLGFGLGWLFCAALTSLFVTELFRLPLAISLQTLAAAAGVIGLAFLATAAAA
ncbi:MAG: ABC transporter permease, partial [Gemmatimonadales bacterium]|nr:ABC transporter permease [Gemmatimonadales bacterium]